MMYSTLIGILQNTKNIDIATFRLFELTYILKKAMYFLHNQVKISPDLGLKSRRCRVFGTKKNCA